MVKGVGLRTRWRRPAWVQIPPPALVLTNIVFYRSLRVKSYKSEYVKLINPTSTLDPR